MKNYRRTDLVNIFKIEVDRFEKNKKHSVEI